MIFDYVEIVDSPRDHVALKKNECANRVNLEWLGLNDDGDVHGDGDGDGDVLDHPLLFQCLFLRRPSKNFVVFLLQCFFSCIENTNKRFQTLP